MTGEQYTTNDLNDHDEGVGEMKLRLLPCPQNITMNAGYVKEFDYLKVECKGTLNKSDLHMDFIQKQFKGVGVNVDKLLTTGAALTVTCSITDTSESNHPAEGYALVLAEKAVAIEAADTAGVFYGFQTLLQIITQCKMEGMQSRGEVGRISDVEDNRVCELPQCEIVDYPDYPNRGILYDITRDRVPTDETIHRLVDMMAR
eukprot:GFYU01042260.1.p1 GENE.GFYU01042260.1~~GFYU01042260.1.p1  ORF type:complete len:202 (-),score=49.88 GFYU01042260.1:4-609(-)